MAAENEPRVIKRYANRKLYDMQESCYITHDEIASLVKSGEDVKIIDNKTKEDLTTLTLTQILFREEKMQRKTLPLHALRGILQSGGDFIQRQITDPLQSLRDEAGETVRNISHVFRRDEEGGSEIQPEAEKKTTATVQAPEPPPSQDDSSTADGSNKNTGATMREWVDNTQRSIETFQRTFEERWSLTFNALTLLNESRQRIAELEARVATLESKLEQADKENA